MKGFIGLGSNLGNREGHLSAGLEQLARSGLRLVAHSGVWETEPLDGAGPGRFLNMVARIETERAPREILRLLLDVERSVGRTAEQHDGPRVLDLDLLLLEGVSIREPDLALPHPRLWLRRFVLAPLAELAPELRNPDTGRTVVEEERALRDGQPGAVRLGELAFARDGLL